MAVDPPRYAPGLPLPGRPFKPGTGQSRPALPSFAPPCRGHPKAEADEAAGLPFRYGVDLFNGGYWWEAHEIWEDLWRRSPRGTARNHLLKGLIMLAAALLKGSSGMPRGRRRRRGGTQSARRAPGRSHRAVSGLAAASRGAAKPRGIAGGNAAAMAAHGRGQRDGRVVWRLIEATPTLKPMVIVRRRRPMQR